MKKNNKTTKEIMYETVYRSYADDIYRICLYYLRDESKAKDITQQVFEIVYKQFNDFDSEYIFGYLVREAKRLINSSENSDAMDE